MTQDRFSFASAADILGAIPALLGFTPENSVVALALAQAEPGSYIVVAAMRIDAVHAEAAAEQLAAAARRQDVDGAPVTAVILAAIADPAYAGAALIGLETIRGAMAVADIDTIRALHAYSLTAGTIYTDLDRNTDGIVPDTSTTDVAMHRAIELGAPIAANRAELTARFTPGDAIPESLALAAAATMGEDFLPVTFDELAAVIGAREIPSADLTARVGLALAADRVEVRDAFLAMTVHGDIDAADTFHRIAARLRGTGRAHALTLAGFFYYLTGDGATASMAIDAVETDAAREGRTVPSFAALMRRALDAGMPPKMLASIGDAITPEYVAAHIGRVQSYT
ncbi:hypothetical protein CH267_00075 [Rhodococcus sp. 06-621-2]|nr:DUF4192 domain-containing protein [Rhodococcus sp. 06-621-2]OZC62794.1 hypothetical protein CH267_00075 [Rhodococcus sp. 06-621-2]